MKALMMVDSEVAYSHLRATFFIMIFFGVVAFFQYPDLPSSYWIAMGFGLGLWPEFLRAKDKTAFHFFGALWLSSVFVFFVELAFHWQMFTGVFSIICFSVGCSAVITLETVRQIRKSEEGVKY